MPGTPHSQSLRFVSSVPSPIRGRTEAALRLFNNHCPTAKPSEGGLMSP